MNVLSWLNVMLLVYVASFLLLLEINKRCIKGKNKQLKQMLKIGRKIHPYAGILLIIGGFIHGYNKLGGQFIFHTGTLLLALLLLNGCVGFFYKHKKTKKFSQAHKFLGVLIVASFFIHYFRPWALN